MVPNELHTIHFNMIIACDVFGTVGDGEKMPWAGLQGDLKRFKELTDGQVLIMGRKTFESLPTFPNGLPNRRTYVVGTKYADDLTTIFLSHQDNRGGFTDPNVVFVSSINDLRHRLMQDILAGVKIDTCWVAGGANIWPAFSTGDHQDLKTTTGLGTSEPVTHVFRFEPVREVHLSLVLQPQRGDVCYKGATHMLSSALGIYGRSDWDIVSQSDHDGYLTTVNGVSTLCPAYTYYHIRDKVKEV
jgi:dihydrofolate reductase